LATQNVSGHYRYDADGRSVLRRYLHTDALGSLVAETDASKAVTNRYHYLPYGGAFGNAPDGPGYTGAVMEPNGLVYMQARYYDPQLGRFLSTDPVDPDPQSGGNFNRYAYAADNPYSKYDPSGRESRDFDWISKQEDIEPPPQSGMTGSDRRWALHSARLLHPQLLPPAPNRAPLRSPIPKRRRRLSTRSQKPASAMRSAVHH
jgi:RHS repeat-associated protein